MKDFPGVELDRCVFQGAVCESYPLPIKSYDPQPNLRLDMSD